MTRKVIAEKLAKEIEKICGIYSKIEIYPGVFIKGVDRFPTINKVFPKTFNGKSFLDVGCYVGTFCIEAKKRNAGKVVGIDRNLNRVKYAKKLAAFLGLDIKYSGGDIDNKPLPGIFDYVGFFNVIHHVNNPIKAIHRIYEATRIEAYIEFPNIQSKEFKANATLKSKMNNLPIIGFGHNFGIKNKNLSYKYLISPAAMKKICLNLIGFKQVYIIPSPFKRNRCIAIAKK